MKNQENKIQTQNTENEFNNIGNAEPIANVELFYDTCEGACEAVTENEKNEKISPIAASEEASTATDEESLLIETQDANASYGGEESIVDLLLGKTPEAAETDSQDGEEDEYNPEPTEDRLFYESGEDFEEMSLIPIEEDEAEEEEALIAEKENGEEPEDEPYNPEKPRKIDSRFDFVELFIFTLALVMIISSFFFRHSVVTGASMENTLFEGEHIIISDLFYTPKHGDIIVCTDYTTAIKKPIVKRIIAVGGDTVKITTAGEVYVNDILLNEDYVMIDMPGYEYRELDITVPEGELFVMGDHRNESSDSRDPYVGTISEDSVLGRVLLRFYPFDRFGKPD